METPMDKPVWLVEGLKHLGQREVSGPLSNQWIKSLWGQLGSNWLFAQYGNDDSRLPWCGAFVGAMLQNCGYRVPTHYYRARDWLTWGTPLREPVMGAVVVFERTGGGHVGFVRGRDTQGRLLVLGGNQGDAVTVAPFDTTRVLGYRWPLGETIANAHEPLPVFASRAASSKNEA